MRVQKLGSLSQEMFMLTLRFKVRRFPEGGLWPVSDTDRGVILSPADARIHNLLSFFRLDLHPEETEQPAPLRRSITDHRHITRWSSSPAKSSLRSQPPGLRGHTLPDLTDELCGGSACLL